MTEFTPVHGVPVEHTFAEAFDMKATRLVITAEDPQWAMEAAAAMTGFGTSVIACGVEIAVERELAEHETPDGRPGVAILALAVSGRELEKQVPRRAGQCVLTCPTTALYAGLEGDPAVIPDRVALGKSLRYFGDGEQISKVIGGTRYWRIPVMDGEFVCQHDVGRVTGIGGGTFMLLADSTSSAGRACRAAVAAIRPLAGVITPFPGGATRSGSKVGSKYPSLVASTNEDYCPTLGHRGGSALGDDVRAVLEVVIDGLTAADIAAAMKAGIEAACAAGFGRGLLGVTAGNYGGKLGAHHFHLAEVIA
jgi:formylmethanofuran--tetrahydromethanopterin N-formyltransferase